MRQFIKFIFVGILNSGLGYGIIFACMYLVGLSPELSNVVGYGVGLVISYVFHRNFTFRSVDEKKSEFIRFASVFLIAYLANLAALIFMIRVLNVHVGVAQVAAGVIYVGVSYLLNSVYVFNRKRVA